MLPPDEERLAADAADYHVQLRIEDLQAARGEARLRVRVARVFRGPASLRDTRLALAVSCFAAGETAEAAPGDEGSFPLAALQRGAVLEAYLNRTPSGVEVAAGLCGIVPGESDAPQLEVAKWPDAAPGAAPKGRLPALALLAAAGCALAALCAWWLLA